MARIFRLDEHPPKGFRRPRGRRASEAQLHLPFPIRVARLVPAADRPPAGADAPDAPEIDPAEAANALCDLGVSAADGGDLTAALDAFAGALAWQPAHCEAHYNLANVYLDRGWSEPARVHYTVAVALSPGFAPAHYNLALTLADLGRWSEAVTALDAFRRLGGEAEGLDALAAQLRAAAHA